MSKVRRIPQIERRWSLIRRCVEAPMVGVWFVYFYVKIKIFKMDA